jgi:hypothetical protein
VGSPKAFHSPMFRVLWPEMVVGRVIVADWMVDASVPSSSSLIIRSFASFLRTIASSEEVAVYSTLDWLHSAIVLRKRVPAPFGEKFSRSIRVLSCATKPLFGS